MRRAAAFTVPAGLPDRPSVLQVHRFALRLPRAPLGWQGLLDLLGDLSWLPPGDVTIRHLDRPLRGTPDGEAYAALLGEAARSWAERPEGWLRRLDGPPRPTRRALRVLLPP